MTLFVNTIIPCYKPHKIKPRTITTKVRPTEGLNVINWKKMHSLNWKQVPWSSACGQPSSPTNNVKVNRITSFVLTYVGHKVNMTKHVWVALPWKYQSSIGLPHNCEHHTKLKASVLQSQIHDWNSCNLIQLVGSFSATESCTIAACSSATTEIESGAKLECFAIMLTELSAKVNVKPNRWHRKWTHTTLRPTNSKIYHQLYYPMRMICRLQAHICLDEIQKDETMI